MLQHHRYLSPLQSISRSLVSGSSVFESMLFFWPDKKHRRQRATHARVLFWTRHCRNRFGRSDDPVSTDLRRQTGISGKFWQGLFWMASSYTLIQIK
jgi:hypothetical protein